MDDPYHVLFGASNDMLSGKGLKNWEWIHKSFPRWILREMTQTEETDTRRKRDKDDTSGPRYPRKVEIRNEDADVPRKREESYFPQPAFRATLIERDDPSGIVSPSDLRRPREQPRVKNVGKPMTEDLSKSEFLHSVPRSDASTGFEASPAAPPKSAESFRTHVEDTRRKVANDLEHMTAGASTTEEDFVKQLVKDKTKHDEPAQEPGESTWRQTALQRRLSRGVVTEPEVELALDLKSNDKAYPPTQETKDTSPLETPEKPSPIEAVHPGTTQVKESEPKSSISHEPAPVPARSTSKILSQLPEEDIDFLSAADIRASMGMKRSKIPTDEQKIAERHALEDGFVKTHGPSQDINQMIESKILNDQFVRRIERQMREPQESPEMKDSMAKQTVNNTAAEEGILESSIERMKSWLEQGGAIFSNHFWQDPAEEADAKKTRLFSDKVLERIRKGRLTLKQVIADLETDIPLSKPLLKRMKGDEELLDAAIHNLRQRSGNGKLQPLTPKKLRAVQELRFKFQNTDRELDAAYAELREIATSDAAKSASPAFKRRLAIAAKMTQKNAHLTRYLIWSLQARLEDPEINQNMLANYKAVANSLLTLRDTQVALSRLVERAMLVYDVVPKTNEDIDMLSRMKGIETSAKPGQDFQHQQTPGISELNKAHIRAKVAAEERLAHEVDAQKLAMRGLSDDGYAHEPKYILRKPFEAHSPLAHSLFRPFSPVLQSLGKGTLAEADEEATRKLNDEMLIADVKGAHEDRNGPITAEHMQLADAAEQESIVKKFDMLKDDPPLENLETVSHDKLAQMDYDEAKISSGACHDSKPPTTIEPQTLQEQNGTSDSPEATAVVEATEAGQATPVSAQDASPITVPDPSPDTIVSTAPAASLSTNYTILIHDPKTDTLSHTTSAAVSPRDTSPTIPLHQALAELDAPAKFIPYITKGLEVVSARKDMLVLRDSLEGTASTPAFETVGASNVRDVEDNVVRSIVNPIDGTTRLSPTGYVGPEETREQLERDFDERRRAAEEVGSQESERSEQSQDTYEGQAKKKGGKGAGVVKTAIWAAATCYVVGVVGEIVSMS
jgi:hypothetical protein